MRPAVCLSSKGGVQQAPRAAILASEPDDRIEFATVPEVPGVEFFRVDAVARLWRWHHETYTVSSPPMPLQVEWRYRARLHRTDPATVAFMEPGEVHADLSKHERYERQRVLFFAPETVNAAARELGRPGGEVHWRDGQQSRADLRGELLRAHAAFETETTTLERQSRIAHVLERLLTECSDSRTLDPPPTLEPDAVRKARAFLLDHWADNVSLEELVGVAGIGRFRLVRAFHAAVGLPPHAYQIRVRVGRAMAMIRMGDSLVDVAASTGFTDQSHLARHFTRIVGIAPGRYRQAVR